jgi:hypothetical protein
LRCPRASHRQMLPIVVPDDDGFLVGNPEMDPDQSPSTTAFQLAEPLVGHEVARKNRHAKHAPKAPATTTRRDDAGTPDPVPSTFVRDVNQHDHPYDSLPKNPLVHATPFPSELIDAPDSGA